MSELKDRLLKRGGIRKLIAVKAIPHYLNKVINNPNQLGRELGLSQSMANHWCKDTEKYYGMRPSKERLTEIAKVLGISLDQMFEYAISQDDIEYGFLNEEDYSAIAQYREIEPTEIFGQDKLPTHDDSKAHIKNLHRFENTVFVVYYIHRNANDEEKLEQLIVKTDALKESGVVPVQMIPSKQSSVYYGNITAFPKLMWAQLYFNQRIDDMVEDAGLFMIHYPDKDIVDEEYHCGCGIIISIDRNVKQRLVLQRAVIIRTEDDNYVLEEGLRDTILKVLKQPFNSEDAYLINISDVGDLHRQLFFVMNERH